MFSVEVNGYLHYWLSAALLLIGLYGMLARPNLIRKLMAMNVLQVAVIMFFIALSAKSGATRRPCKFPSIPPHRAGGLG